MTAANPPNPIDWPSVLAHHGRWLRLVVLARVGERHAVEDVFQEIALAAVSQKAPLADPAKLPAWLHRLAVRQSLLYRRGRGRHSKRVKIYAEIHQNTSESDPLDWLLRDERENCVRAALEKLPRRDAEILMLKYADNWSYRDLSERLGISIAAVEARLHRAREKLRSELNKSPLVEVRE